MTVARSHRALTSSKSGVAAPSRARTAYESRENASTRALDDARRLSEGRFEGADGVSSMSIALGHVDSGDSGVHCASCVASHRVSSTARAGAPTKPGPRHEHSPSLIVGAAATCQAIGQPMFR